MLNNFVRYLFLCVLALGSSFTALPARAQGFKLEHRHTRPELVAESQTVAPGQTVAVALTLTPIPHWHTYWENPGDTGIPTTINWTLPPGFSAGPLRFPTPGILRTGDIINYGYNGAATLLTSLTVPRDFAATEVDIPAKASWLACSDELCVPEEAELTLHLAKGDGALNPASATLFQHARARLPEVTQWPASFSRDSKKFQLKIDWGLKAPRLESAIYYPLTGGMLKNGAPQHIVVKGSSLWLETDAEQGKAIPDLAGVLVVRPQGAPTDEAFAFSAHRASGGIILPTDGSVVGANKGDGQGKPAFGAVPALVSALGLALLGGLLLNLMPCVFPVLSLKALALAKSGGNRAHARSEAFAYTTGVVVSFAALGATLLGLRAAGAQIGWGFQLQDPRIVAPLALLFTAMALNLAGLFEINIGFAGAGQSLTEKSGPRGAFWTGVLAVLVASPCTAPFMAGALGAAVVLPPLAGFSIFIALGIGLALPFLLLGLMPRLQRLLPKPGAWMVTFRQLLAFPMLATALWLLWVVGEQAGVNGMAITLLAALCVAFGLWLLGRQQQNPTVRHGLAAVPLAAIIMIGVGVAGAVSLLTPKTSDAKPVAMAHANAQPYSEATLARLIAERKPTFVYFTADWCLTCKVNERSTLRNFEVTTAFDSRGVQVLVGDWTQRNAEITRTLARYGRSGVPLYLYFKPGASLDTPVILNQVLTPGEVVRTING